MPVDHIRYDILVQQALRGMVRNVLADIVKKGLVGDHHFFITFDTNAEGVRLSERMRAQYPEEMTIVLQHQFWDLKVTDDSFEVGLSFGGVAERLLIPLEAIRAFADPSVQFTLQFETLEEEPDEAAPASAPVPEPRANQAREPGKGKRKSPVPARTSVPASPREPTVSPPASPDDQQGGTVEKPGAEVVRLDRFRKK